MIDTHLANSRAHIQVSGNSLRKVGFGVAAGPILDDEEVVGSPLAIDNGPFAAPPAAPNPAPAPTGPNAGTAENNQST